MSYPILYASPEEASAWFAGREDASAWSALTPERKISALDRAGRMLDDLFTWKGIRATSTQMLRWPRKNVFDADGNPVSPEKIPDAIKRGVCEQALFLIDPQREVRRKMNGSGVKNVSLGSLSVGMESGHEDVAVSPLAFQAVRAFGSLRGAGSSGTLMRG